MHKSIQLIKMQKIVIFLIILMYVNISYAQEKFKDWLQQEKHEFQNFLEERDKEFAQFLKTEWSEYTLLQGTNPDLIPKLPEIPLKDFQEIETNRKMPGYKEEDFKITPPPEKESAGFRKIPKLKFRFGKKIDFKFFNTSCSILFDLNLEKIEFPKFFDNTDISDFWIQVSKTQYTYLLNQCKTVKNNLRLNDWAFYQFLEEITEHIYPDDNNLRQLLLWFLMQKCAYDVRVGYIDNEIILLISSYNKLYNLSYINFRNRKYYRIINVNPVDRNKKIKTYVGNYPEAESMIDLNIYSAPVLNPNILNKTLQFNYLDKEYSLSLNINKSIVDFYSEYPLTEYIIYFNAPISSESNYSLLKSLKPILINKSEIEAVNLILHFVQKSFTYKSDFEQFGDENPLFIEETLYYPGSDCEDRAVLFSYLVRNLLKLDVIGLDYPGHIATAVNMKTHINGKYVNYQGKDYIICDPTYINANLGQCLPKYKNMDPEIISLHQSR